MSTGVESLVESGGAASAGGSDAALVELGRVCKTAGEIPNDAFISSLTAIIPALDDIATAMHKAVSEPEQHPLPDWVPHALLDSFTPIVRVLATQLPPDPNALKLSQQIIQCMQIQNCAHPLIH
jgi:hypothetical protein